MNLPEPYWQSDDGAHVLYCGDCLEILPLLGKVDAVVTDPPYGLEWKGTGFQKQFLCNWREASSWDSRPDEQIFKLILSIGTWIVWGGNYFASILGDCKAPLLWDKMTGNNNFADGELAWTSFNTGTLRIFRHQWCGAFKDSERGIRNFHPTQKPIAVMEWCLSHLPDEYSTILDPFAGSGTTAVACIRTGRRSISIEKEPKYCEIARKRMEDAIGVGTLFDPKTIESADMFAAFS